MVNTRFSFNFQRESLIKTMRHVMCSILLCWVLQEAMSAEAAAKFKLFEVNGCCGVVVVFPPMWAVAPWDRGYCCLSVLDFLK